MKMENFFIEILYSLITIFYSCFKDFVLDRKFDLYNQYLVSSFHSLLLFASKLYYEPPKNYMGERDALIGLFHRRSERPGK